MTINHNKSTRSLMKNKQTPVGEDSSLNIQILLELTLWLSLLIKHAEGRWIQYVKEIKMFI